MKTYEECKDETAKNAGYDDWKHFQLSCFKDFDGYAEKCKEKEQEAADKYADQFQKPDPTYEEIHEAAMVGDGMENYVLAFKDGVEWIKRLMSENFETV